MFSDGHGDPRRGRGPPEGGAGSRNWGPAGQPPRDPHGVAGRGPSTALDYAIEASRRAARRICATSTAGSSPMGGRTSTTPPTDIRTSTSTPSGSTSSNFNGPPGHLRRSRPSDGINGPEAAGTAGREWNAPARPALGVSLGTRVVGRCGFHGVARLTPATPRRGSSTNSTPEFLGVRTADGPVTAFFGRKPLRQRRRDERAPVRGTASTPAARRGRELKAWARRGVTRREGWTTRAGRASADRGRPCCPGGKCARPDVDGPFIRIEERRSCGRWAGAASSPDRA